MDPNPLQDPHQIKIWIRIGYASNPDQDMHQFSDDSQIVWNISLFEHFFKDLSLYFEALILIRILIRVKS